ncbi:MAG: hypothetical protein K0Q77_1396 [Anaerosporomusa subterranea]|jgi:hypothetical protein|nr:hypothetical protein [Anaerosporomusa subterranea]
MGIRHGNLLDGTMWEFGRPAFWAVHLAGAAVLFFLGMRFAVRRVPVPIMLFSMLRSLLRH